MLRLEVTIEEGFDEKTNEFLPEVVVLYLEHSLISLSKWESKYKKPFLNDEEKSTEDTMSYLKQMVMNEDVPDNVLEHLTQEQMDLISEYINDSMTATWFVEPPMNRQRSNRKPVITSELIYYWMIASEIPFECQHWHLSRLLTLIRVCSVKNSGKQEMNKEDKRHAAEQRRRLNEERKAKYNTSG